MNRDTTVGNFVELIGWSKEVWGTLTENTVVTLEGQTQRLVGRLQRKYGSEQRRIEKRIDEFLSTFSPPARKYR